MKLEGISVAVALLAQAACSNAPPTTSYAVTIDSAFTPDQAESIVAGLDDWRAALPEVDFHAMVAACPTTPSEGSVCVRPAFDGTDASSNLVGETSFEGTSGAVVVLYVERIRATGMDVARLIQQTTAHEIGHVMGLKHSGAGALMAAKVPDQAHSVTAVDVAQFWAVRGR